MFLMCMRKERQKCEGGVFQLQTECEPDNGMVEHSGSNPVMSRKPRSVLPLPRSTLQTLLGRREGEGATWSCVGGCRRAQERDRRCLVLSRNLGTNHRMVQTTIAYGTTIGWHKPPLPMVQQPGGGFLSYLAGVVQPFPYYQVGGDPRHGEVRQQLPPDVAHGLDAGADAQDGVAEGGKPHRL